MNNALHFSLAVSEYSTYGTSHTDYFCGGGIWRLTAGVTEREPHADTLRKNPYGFEMT